MEFVKRVHVVVTARQLHRVCRLRDPTKSPAKSLIPKSSTLRSKSKYSRRTPEPEYRTSSSPSPEPTGEIEKLRVSIAQEGEVLGMSILDESVSETTLLQSLKIDIADLFPNLDDFGTLASSNTLRASDLLTEGCEVVKSMVYHNFSMKHRLLVAQGWCSFADFAQFVVDHQFLGFHVVANRNRIREAYAKLRGLRRFRWRRVSRMISSFR